MAVEGEPAQPSPAMDSTAILKHMLQEYTATISVLDHTAQMELFHLGGRQQPGKVRGAEAGMKAATFLCRSPGSTGG